LLGALPQARGIALDASRDASRRAARRHQRIAAVRTDVWQQIPLSTLHTVRVDPRKIERLRRRLTARAGPRDRSD
jgi:hypothetical protein